MTFLDQNHGGFMLHTLMRRLEIIRAAISLADEALLAQQLPALQAAQETSGQFRNRGLCRFTHPISKRTRLLRFVA